MTNPWGNSSNFGAYTNTTSTLSTTYPLSYGKADAVIDTPAFVQIDMLNNSKISGRFVRYSDPTRADNFGAWVGEDSEGTKTYVLWAGILRLTVFPLDAVAPKASALEKTAE